MYFEFSNRFALAMAPAVAAATLGLLVLGLTAATAAQDGPANVLVVDNAFQPSSVTVEVGESVNWSWAANNSHSVSAPGTFDSHPSCSTAAIRSCGSNGDSFSWTAEDVGEIAYRCRIHPGMTGVVHVVEAGAEPTEEPTDEPTPDPTPLDPTEEPSPSPTPTSTFGPPPPRETAPPVVVEPTGSPEPSGPAPTPSLEPFPEPSVVTPSSGPTDESEPDTVEVAAPDADDGRRSPAVVVLAFGLFGISVVAFGRLVLFGPSWEDVEG